MSLLDGIEQVEVRKGDLLLRKEERDRIEEKMGFSEPSEEPVVSLEASDDYRKVWLGDELLSFGPIQAEVIRALHVAHLANDPWQSGKEILTAAGAKSLRMSDVFKANPGWRRVIESNQRGFYRLAVGLRAA